MSDLQAFQMHLNELEKGIEAAHGEERKSLIRAALVEIHGPQAGEAFDEILRREESEKKPEENFK